MLPGLTAGLLLVQSQAGAFPAHMMSPVLVAAGGNVAATSRLGVIGLNPGSGAFARGFEIDVGSFPQTELGGASVMIAAGRRLGVVVGAWSYDVKNLFDDDLIALDPSLAGLSATSVGFTSGLTFRSGGFGIGILATRRAQSIVGAQSAASALSAGVRVNLRRFEIGAALVDVPLGTVNRDVSPDRLALAGVAATLSLGGNVDARIEVNGYAPRARPSDLRGGASVTARISSLEITTGGSPLGGWGAGCAIALQRWRLDAATSFRSAGQLDQRLAVGLTYR